MSWFKRKPKSKLKRNSQYDEKYLWPIFSLFTRFRDTDDNGYGKCFTCPLIRHWKDLDAGHYISRKNYATKYSEVGVKCQCGGCNSPYIGGGRPEEFAKGIDKLYGPGTADKLKIASKKVMKYTHFEFDTMTDVYYEQVIEMAKKKGIDPMSLKPIKAWYNKKQKA